MSSILTNQSAIVALQTLKSVNSNLSKAQSEISTGKSVANAKDNAAVWAISKVMETDQSANKTMQSMLNVAGQAISTARLGAERITDVLGEIKNLALGANNSVTESERAKIRTDIELKFKEIASVINGTQMNGVNLLKGPAAEFGSATPSDTEVAAVNAVSLTVVGSLDRAAGSATTTVNKINVANTRLQHVLGINLGTGVASMFGANALNLADPTAASAAPTAVSRVGPYGVANSANEFIANIEAAISVVVAKTAELGSAGKRISDQTEFIGKMADSLKVGIGSLVDADMEEASARLQALQTQQQLGIQSLSIANQAPSAILSLFR
ncbi:flagellin [Paracoccus tibetensis]|uniref:Flagellin n=1 Tax=Paracoccus tibetensis TaxID=336292 RepID=A0A1G5ERZ0_9RHOB|nr:flagellin [Paracoccus tibetensis]SCY29541.1 flagellin [Paracoccus tibetensis]